MTIQEKRLNFRNLHEQGCFLLPNAWDVGSARFFQSAGFSAIASTSAGFAFSKGRKDSYLSKRPMTLEETLAHLKELVEGCDLPVNADFEDGFSGDREGLTRNVRLCADTGVAGLSIEDNQQGRLFPFEEAVARVKVAVEALRGTDVILVARTEGFLLEKPDLKDSLRRLRAYAEAGADCLYAPGITRAKQVEAVVEACSPKPVNVLVYAPFFTVPQLRDLGVRRISLGGALARAAWGGMMRAAREMLESGTFRELGKAAPTSEIHSILE